MRFIRQQFDVDPTILHDLADCAYTHMQRDPSSQLGVGTGWSGAKTFVEDFCDCFAAKWLEAAIQTVLGAAAGYWFDVSVWANIMRAGDECRIHDHKRSHKGGENAWAGVFYVAGDDLQLHLGSGPVYCMEPEIGELVAFPADTLHAVPAYQGNEARISLAFSGKQ